jgi:hypothetical protein
MRPRWLLALVLAGCFSSKSGGTAAPSNAAPPPAPIAPKHAELARTIADPLGFLPVDSEIVLHFDAARLRRSAIWRQYEPAIVQALSSGLQRAKDLCGIDPIAQLATIRVGLKTISKRPDGVMVVTGLDNGRLRTCIAANGATGSNFTADGDVVVGTTDDGQPVALELVGASTIVFVLGPGTDRARLDEVLHSGSPLRGSAAFGEIFSSINTQTALWFLVNGRAEAFDQARALGFTFGSAFGSIGVVDGLSASMRVRVDTPATATQWSSTFSSQVGPAKAFVDRLDISADANDIVIELGMTDTQITTLVGLLGGLAGFNTAAPLPSPSPSPAPVGGAP